MSIRKKYLILFLVIIILLGLYIVKVNIGNKDSNKELSKITYEEAKEMKEPMVLYFTSDSCFACKIIKPTLVDIQKEYKNKLNIVSISLDDPNNYFIANLYNVRVTPTLVYLNEEKEYVTKSEGAISHSEIAKYLKEIGVK
ncbi:thioredoxin family protein [Clostridium fallax]|uniref:Thioredoxin 1 n=1 Tax=Clostridium fallax TaxID=1533 RepID=A0A1M4WC27_9CLOT|nr:thioredoxin family protein [Clostridium fallax]SHE78603.1 thioredoxin 1 [Clostridium fallax]SQB05909.1 thioredoxin family protein [Clostridium fallax]